MTRIIATNENNDIYLGLDGHLAIKTGIQATLQACEHACLAQRGEMIYAVDRGMPTMDTLWGGVTAPRQYEAAVRAAILAVDGVVRVLSLTYEVVDGIFKYYALIETIYGNGEISG